MTQHLVEVGLGGVGVLAVPDIRVLFRDRTRTPESQVETLDLLQQCYLGKVGLGFLISKMGTMVLIAHTYQVLCLNHG